jgi:hypothetical protein
MTGEKNLDVLLASMSPTLRPGEFVFYSLQEAHYGDFPELEPIAAVEEEEGLTLVIPKSAADGNKISYESVFRCITLNVHSSLEAVGLTAAVSSRLAEHGISANMLAGYFHDHILVQKEFAEKAIALLDDFKSR